MSDFTVTPRALTDLGWDQLRQALASRATTPRGAELARALPFLDRAAAELSLRRIEEARALLRRQLPLPIGEIEDVRDTVQRAEKGALLAAPELMACASVGRAGGVVRRFVLGLEAEAPLLGGMARALVDLSPLASRIDATFEPSGVMRDDASAALSAYRKRARALHQEIRTRLERILNDAVVAERLQERYFSVRNDRYVLPLKTQFRAAMPGIVHNASQSGQTIFVEPEELIGSGNELAIAESLAAEEERRVLAELSGEVGGRAAQLAKNVEALGELDVVQAAGRLADSLEASPPELVEADAPLELRRARHPLLVLAGKSVVPNSIALRAGQRALVISGPNAGGKTVAMATVGICVLMTRAGLPIPASSGSTVPLAAGLACAIGDAQDLTRDLSTFTAHLTELASLLRQARRGWICLIDEIAAGTDPIEGAALATAILESLVDAGVRVVVTTHLDPVKAFAVVDRRFENARFSLDPATLRPTFELELGAAGVSKAIDVAAHVGLPPEVIARARAGLEEGGALSLALAALDRERSAVAQERAELSSLRAELRSREEQLAGLQAEATAARREAEQVVRRELATEIEAALRLAADSVARLQQDELGMAEAQKAQRELRAALEEQRRRQAPAAGAPPAAGAIEVGSRVRLSSLGQEGEVLAIEDGQALVAVGALRTRARLAELVLLAGGGKKGERSVRQPARAEPAAQCDVRGLRADEALRRLEADLDRSYAAGAPSLLVVHGHGSGALRHAVREALEGSPYVADFRPGTPEEGGDGVTLVQLRG